MNERLEDFMWKAKAFAKHQQLVDYDFLEKFAELIVNECRYTVSENFNECQSATKMDRILQDHFGLNNEQ
jgi:hypothetical protein